MSKDFKSNGRLPPNPHNKMRSRDPVQAASVSFNRESEERSQITSLWQQYNQQKRISTELTGPNQTRVGGYLMSKHQKIMSFESSLDEINPKESESLLEHTQGITDRLFGLKDMHA